MAASPKSTFTPPPEAPIPDDDHLAASLQLPLSASVVLSSLPRDAQAALAKVDDLEGKKVTIRFQPIGSAPQLRQRVFKISASNRFETVVNFLRKKLGVERTESVFCYINSVFAPGLDEGVGGLWRCFKSDDQLIVAYSTTPAFG
ncbi:Ubiquitin-like protein [Bachmanniomyces sp. S44760]|nr:Ubiquitin-like protein [Bachmanniomyces sp. S44760]